MIAIIESSVAKVHFAVPAPLQIHSGQHSIPVYAARTASPLRVARSVSPAPQCLSGPAVLHVPAHHHQACQHEVGLCTGLPPHSAVHVSRSISPAPRCHVSPARVLAQSRVRHVHHTSTVAHWQAAPHNEPFSAAEASAEQRQEHFEHMLEALWRRASAIAEDCTRWNQVLQEKERETAELADMIRLLSAEYVGRQNPNVTLPAEHAASDATELRTFAANLPAIRHDPSHEVDSELPVQSLPLQNASPVPYAQVRAPAPESTEVADTDVYSPARTRHADISEGGALDSFRL